MIVLMLRRISLILLGLILMGSVVAANDQNKYSEVAMYSDEVAIQFFPDYPPVIGQLLKVSLRTFKPAEKVSLFTDREIKIPLKYHDGHWRGEYLVPADYQEGGHFFTVMIRYPYQAPPKVPWWQKIIPKKQPKNERWKTTVVWYQAFNQKKPKYNLEMFQLRGILPESLTTEAESDETIPVSLEGVSSGPLEIKGSQSITFKSRTLIGSKEGEAPGTQQSREETLRVSVKGKAAETDIEASLLRTSATGVAQVGDQEEKISILLRHGSTEAYLGDFTADFTETEFTRLDKVLSGGRAKGDYGLWGFSALYSSPKGEAKYLRLYGDGTQGPYRLGNAPVVIDSERVYVDGMLYKRGDQYTIDYQAGTVTFLKAVINQRSVVQIYYDYRQALYTHATYGLRSYYKPYANLKVGITYLDDSDLLAGAADIRSTITGEAIEPQSHRLVGVDANYVSENLTLAGEGALSLKDTNILSADSVKQEGKAGKIALTTTLGPVGLTGHAKKVGSSFLYAANPDPEQGVWEYGYGLSYRPSYLLALRGNQEYKKFTRSSVQYENQYQTAKAQLTPERWPSLEYNYSETIDSNDPVSGTAIKRKITKNSAESLYSFSFWQTSLKGTKERWLNQTPSVEATDYQRVNFGLATAGLEKITFSSNVELEDRQEPNGGTPSKKTYNLSLSAAPSSAYFAASSLNIVEDSRLGKTEVVDLSYKAEPHETFKTDGKYTITSVNEEFPTTSEAVSRQSGSFSLDYRPWKEIRLRYLYKPNFTLLARTSGRTYNNEQQQTEVTLLPTRQTLLGAVLKTGNSFNISRSDYPAYSVKENNEDTNSALYTLKMAPLPIFSTEFNWFQENSHAQTLAATQEPWTYTDGRGTNRKFDAIVKTSLSERFSLDSRYTFQKTDRGIGEALSNIADTKAHTASLKGSWQYDDSWTWSLTTAYTRTTDLLLGSLSYTLTPGFGFIYRQGDLLRVDFEYTHAQSYAGSTTAKDKYSLRTKYALSDSVDVTLRAEQENSSAPDYRLSDITGNVEIKL